MMMAAVSTYSLRCPRCKQGSIRSNTLGEQINIVGIDPFIGHAKEGKALGFTPSEGPCVIYFCDDCGYKNVVFSMFVRAEPDPRGIDLSREE